MHRILAIALACASLYAAVLGQRATAQDANPSPEPTTTESPVSDPIVSAATPVPTATPSPEPRAFLAPEPTATATPAAAASTPAPTPAAAPTPADDQSHDDAVTGQPEKKKDDGSARRKRSKPKPRPSCGTGEKLEGRVGKPVAGLPGRPVKDPSTSTSGCDDDHGADPDDDSDKAPRDVTRTKLRRPDGRPTVKNPTFSSASPGAAPIGVPNFFIEKFRIPPFLLPIYQAAGMEYGVRWEVLAAINEIETDYGRNLNVSSAGALGWMQFMPATWKAYGVDGNHDGRKDPYNPVDAIFAAARYLRASGADTDLRRAIFAYNHAGWYVDSVLMRAQVLGGLPSNFVGSLTGLTQARFPVYAKASYADELESRGRRAKAGDNAAFAVESQEARREIRIFARRGAPVIAANDGRVVAIGRSKRLGRYLKLQDVYGNTFTYANLGKVSKTHPVLKPRLVTRNAIARELELPKPDARPRTPASTTRKAAAASKRRADRRDRAERTRLAELATHDLEVPYQPATSLSRDLQRQRMYSHPSAGIVLRDFEPIAGSVDFDPSDYDSHVLRKGSRVIAGTVLGRLGPKHAGQAPHLRFEIRPAGRGAPRIDPKPILDGWKLLESTAIYRAAGRNPFFGRDAKQPSIGQILLMSKEALMRRVVRNPRVQIYECGERDVIGGQIDRRVLATLEFLAASGLRPTVTSLKCGHGYYTAGGRVSHHSSGNAVDIAAVNGIPIIGHQGRGSITDITIQRLLTLQGTMKPDQIISLMTFEGTDNTYAMGDHDDHIHVGWRPLFASSSREARQINSILQPRQWLKLMDRLNRIDNPRVREQPSRYAVKVVRRASRAHRGE